MMMRLNQLQINAKGSEGLSSDLLTFGENITQLYGENGCGKSPIIQSILYCLGYPCVFRELIYEMCEYVLLKVFVGEVEYSIKRFYSKTSIIIEVKSNNLIQKFTNEAEYSEFIFSLLDLRYESLVSNRKEKVYPYLSTILPIFYLNQEDGYSNIYSPKSSFIMNQLSEMIRIIFDFPLKNSFEVKRLQIEAKKNLDSLEEKLNDYEQKVNIELSNLSVKNEPIELITSRIEDLEKQIEILKSSGASKNESVEALDRLIILNNKKIQSIKEEANSIERRRNGIGQIISEIEMEIQTLNLNESARRIFHYFDNICGTKNCQMFSESTQEYSKNLLYLRDQIKDLKRNDALSDVRINELLAERKCLKHLIEEIEFEKKEVVNESEISSLLKSIEKTKYEIFELQVQLFEIQRIGRIKEKQVEYSIVRNKALEKYQSYSQNNRINPNIDRFKSELRDVYTQWLDVLKTPNIDKEIIFDRNFKPEFGSEKINQLKGSTLTRAVLAYHASLFELMCINGCLSFGFIVFDTPRQHELNNDHLDSYLKKLKEICIEYNVQIIFSTSTYHYKGDNLDVEWNPKYIGLQDGGLKFLKVNENIF